jgi:hypothetical protein
MEVGRPEIGISKGRVINNCSLNKINIMKTKNNEKLIAVIGATGHQGGAVVRGLQANGQFKVRALTRNPDKHRELAEEVAQADLDRPETLPAAFEGAHGVFSLVTNFWEAGTDELKQATTAVRAAKAAGVKHFVWSTLPDVEAISGGRFDVPHFTGKAKDRSDSPGSRFCESYVRHRAFLLPEPCGRYGSAEAGRRILGWALPLDPNVRCIHMGDIRELATSLPVHSLTRIRQAMASICPSSVIS